MPIRAVVDFELLPMTDPTITKDPFLRKTALSTAGIALALIALGVAAFLLLRPDPIPNFEIDVRLVEPTDATRLTIDSIDCPDERGPSPFPGSAFRDQARTPAEDSFGAGQAVVYLINVVASDVVPDSGRWNVAWASGMSPDTGVACAFVVADDPETVELSTGTGATARWFPVTNDDGVAGQLALRGLEPNEQAIVALIVEIEPNGRESSRLQFTIDPVTGTSSNSVERTDRASYSLPTTLDEELNLTIDDRDGVDPGSEFATTFVVTNPTSHVVSNTSLIITVDNDATLSTDVSVIDDIGFRTACAFVEPPAADAIPDEPTFGVATVVPVANSITCQLGFLNPGEIVTVETTTDTPRRAIAYWSRSNGQCESDGQQDLCTSADLAWQSSFSQEIVTFTEANNLADGADLSVRLEAATDVVYLNRTVTTLVNIATDVTTGVTLDEVSMTGCPEATYIDGDLDEDGRVEAGELWQYSCASRYDEDGNAEAQVIGTVGGQPVRGAAEISFEVINPAFEILRIEVEGQDDIILRVINIGDDPITRIALTAERCNPRLTSNADGDEILEPEEIWEYTCPAGATGGDIFGRDSLGAPLSAAVDQGF